MTYSDWMLYYGPMDHGATTGEGRSCQGPMVLLQEEGDVAEFHNAAAGVRRLRLGPAVLLWKGRSLTEVPWCCYRREEGLPRSHGIAAGRSRPGSHGAAAEGSATGILSVARELWVT